MPYAKDVQFTESPRGYVTATWHDELLVEVSMDPDEKERICRLRGEDHERAWRAAMARVRGRCEEKARKVYRRKTKGGRHG